MWAGSARLLAAPHHPLSKLDVGFGPQGHPGPLEFRPGEDEQPPQFVLVEIPDGVDQVSIE